MPTIRWEPVACVLLAALALPLGAASPLGADTHIVASDKPGGYGYLTEDVVVDVAGTLTLTNVDLRAHDVVAFASGPSDNPWCASFIKRACPLFASQLIGLAEQTTVAGIDQLTPLSTYEFYCSIHPWMTGTIIAI